MLLKIFLFCKKVFNIYNKKFIMAIGDKKSTSSGFGQTSGGFNNSPKKPFSSPEEPTLDKNLDPRVNRDKKLPKSPTFVPDTFLFSELNYLFSPNTQFTNNDNTNTIDGFLGTNEKDYTVIFKDPTTNNTNSIKKYVAEWVNAFENKNPYAALVEEFSKPWKKAMRLRPSDFAYLTNLGVYPSNRLWILRRYPESAVVPDNLDQWEKPASPVATLIGWVKPSDEDMFSITFGETWTQVTKMLHTQLLEILSDFTGMKPDKIIPIPALSRGLLFQFLRQMGGNSEWGVDEIPIGEPNVLRTASSRMATPDDAQNLKSAISFPLETSYEMKLIGDVDPGSAMLDILDNIVYMGTSNTKFFMNANSSIVQKLLVAANSPNSAGAWMAVIEQLVSDFMAALQKVFTASIDFIKSVGSTVTSIAGSISGTTIDTVTLGKTLTDMADKSPILKSLLTSTVAIYRWPLKGSIALMTGLSSTPWHLTIGNPVSPFISVSNVLVGDIGLSWSNELGYNDMPTRINVKLTATLGRPLGAQEIVRMFNNSYQRVYNPKTDTFKIRKTGTYTGH